MKRLLLVFAVLALFNGTAFAGNLTDLQTAELAADAKGRSALSDNSVILKLWYVGDATDGQTAGVSSNTILMLYDESSSTSIDTLSPSYNTIGEVVDYINASVTDWRAAIGNDAYRDMTSSYLLGQDITAAPYTSNLAIEILLDCSSANFITCGISGLDNTLNRMKSITHRVAGTGSITARIFTGSAITGDTVIWRKDIGAAAYNTDSTGVEGQSPDTVNFAIITNGKGVSGNRGQPLVCRIDRTTINATNTAAKTDEVSLSITYDQIVK